ncbi:MAG: hypothetical protein AAB116_21200, partial [Candidatus Poribacteria bacterium]
RIFFATQESFPHLTRKNHIFVLHKRRYACKITQQARKTGSLGLDWETTVRAKHLHIKDALF